MTAEQALRRMNRGMAAFDLALGTGAMLAPRATLRMLGHEPPAEGAEHLFGAAMALGFAWLAQR